MKISDIIPLFRPHQWYKNLAIFLAIIFSQNILNLNYLEKTFYGFLILIIISSTNYILNDLIDIKRDHINPEKRKRPLASGRITKKFAIITFLILLFSGLTLAYSINLLFFYSVLGMFILSTLYTFYLKNIIFADLLAISSLFVLRAIAGAVIINVQISPWLIIGVFFLALFLVTGKRYGELNFLKEKSSDHRNVLGSYSKKLLFSLFDIFLAILILSFALYSISSKYKYLILTTPLFIYILLRYYFLILSNNKIIRNPEKAITDPPLLIATILFIILSLILIML